MSKSGLTRKAEEEKAENAKQIHEQSKLLMQNMSSRNLYETDHSRNNRGIPRTTLRHMAGKNPLGCKTVELKRETVSMTPINPGKLAD